jgi:hypothetical protein
VRRFTWNSCGIGRGQATAKMALALGMKVIAAELY